MSDDAQTEQQVLDAFREMNRYDGRHEEWPSAAVYEPPIRTLSNFWQKFHAARDCGAGRLQFVEKTRYRTTSEKHAFEIYCRACRHAVPEEEILFVGGDWYSRHGWTHYGRSLEDLFIPPERVLELGPDPDREELEHALELGRIERASSFLSPLSVSNPADWRTCESCGHDVPLLFDECCRMCYDGEWTDRMQDSVNAFEDVVRVQMNNSFVHRLGQKVDPLSIHDRCFEDMILWRRHDAESVPKLVEVKQCLQDDSDGHWEYVLTDMTNTTEHRYHEEDLADCFWDTGLYNRDYTEGVQDDRIREVYQRVCDHSFHDVHTETDDGELVPDGQQCVHCRKRRDG